MSKYFSKVFERDNHRCVYCGKDMLSDFESFMSVEEDHLLPKSSNGADGPDNIVTSCNVCNRLKGNYKPQNIDIKDRSKYIADVRRYIMERRSVKIKEFMSWAIPNKSDYHT